MAHRLSRRLRPRRRHAPAGPLVCGRATRRARPPVSRRGGGCAPRRRGDRLRRRPARRGSRVRPRRPPRRAEQPLRHARARFPPRGTAGRHRPPTRPARHPQTGPRGRRCGPVRPVSECVVCGDSVSVSDACVHCGAPVCATHRDPAAHDCPGVESDSDRWYTDPDAGRVGAGSGESTGAGARGADLSNPRRVAVSVLAVVAVALVGTALLAATTGPLAFDESQAESRIVAETNEVRSERGLGPLAGNASLARVARAHSADMARQEYVGHVAPNGSTPADRLDRFGVDCYAAENIYYTEQGDCSSPRGPTQSARSRSGSTRRHTARRCSIPAPPDRVSGWCGRTATST
ncbi:hypothetical protein Nmn1133_12545 [Halosegnis longus]|uniref:AN1-type domain-containing protein n=1 Tax=Halosegnis longus TaxID=2216012 RepID=A0AAJ4RAS3_9EURY|nr:hypothetical protein Nmn1133_12545 [Salella cibi]